MTNSIHISQNELAMAFPWGPDPSMIFRAVSRDDYAYVRMCLPLGWHWLPAPKIQVFSMSFNLDDFSVLMIAARYGSVRVVRELLCHKETNINARDRCGWSALDFAIAMERKPVIELLLQAGATFQRNVRRLPVKCKCVSCKDGGIGLKICLVFIIIFIIAVQPVLLFSTAYCLVTWSSVFPATAEWCMKALGLTCLPAAVLSMCAGGLWFQEHSCSHKVMAWYANHDASIQRLCENICGRDVSSEIMALLREPDN